MIMWTIIIELNYLSGITKANAIKMNFTIRNSILEKLIYKDYEEYKDYDTSASVFWLTNDIYLIENNEFENIFTIIC